MKQDQYLIEELEKLKLPKSGLKEIIEESTGFMATILGTRKATMVLIKELQEEETFGYKAYEAIYEGLRHYNKNIRIALTL